MRRAARTSNSSFFAAPTASLACASKRARVAPENSSNFAAHALSLRSNTSARRTPSHRARSCASSISFSAFSRSAGADMASSCARAPSVKSPRSTSDTLRASSARISPRARSSAASAASSAGAGVAGDVVGGAAGGAVIGAATGAGAGGAACAAGTGAGAGGAGAGAAAAGLAGAAAASRKGGGAVSSPTQE